MSKKGKKKITIKLGSEAVLVSKRNRVFLDKKKESSLRKCRKKIIL